MDGIVVLTYSCSYYCWLFWFYLPPVTELGSKTSCFMLQNRRAGYVSVKHVQPFSLSSWSGRREGTTTCRFFEEQQKPCFKEIKRDTVADIQKKMVVDAVATLFSNQVMVDETELCRR